LHHLRWRSRARREYECRGYGNSREYGEFNSVHNEPPLLVVVKLNFLKKEKGASLPFLKPLYFLQRQGMPCLF
jgi:hypothetical protein